MYAMYIKQVVDICMHPFISVPCFNIVVVLILHILGFSISSPFSSSSCLQSVIQVSQFREQSLIRLDVILRVHVAKTSEG